MTERRSQLSFLFYSDFTNSPLWVQQKLLWCFVFFSLSKLRPSPVICLLPDRVHLFRVSPLIICNVFFFFFALRPSVSPPPVPCDTFSPSCDYGLSEFVALRTRTVIKQALSFTRSRPAFFPFTVYYITTPLSDRQFFGSSALGRRVCFYTINGSKQNPFRKDKNHPLLSTEKLLRSYFSECELNVKENNEQ